MGNVNSFMKITSISLVSDGVVTTLTTELKFLLLTKWRTEQSTGYTQNDHLLYPLVDLLPQMLPGSRNVRHVFIQDVLLGADAVILNVLRPVQLAHIKVKCLQVGKDG